MQEEVKTPPVPTTTVPETIPENPLEEIREEAQEIKEQLIKTNSMTRRFFLAIITGFGTVMGATVVVALVLYILSLFSHVGFIGQFTNWTVDTIKDRVAR